MDDLNGKEAVQQLKFGNNLDSCCSEMKYSFSPYLCKY